MQEATAPNWTACVDRLYDAVGREHRLAEALGAFRPSFDARGVTFLSFPDGRNPTTVHTGSIGVSERALVEYHTHFNVHDEWVLAANRRSDFGPGAMWRGSDLVDRRRLRQSYFWKAFLARHGVIDILTAVVEAPSSDEPGSFITFHRHQGQRPFAKADLSQLRRLAPHLRHVLRLHRRLAPALAIGSTLQELVYRLELPIFFIAGDGRTVQRNPAADGALADAQGWLQERGGSLHLSTAQGWSDLSSALTALHENATGSIALDLVNPERHCATLSLRAVHGAASDRVAQHPAVAIATLSPGARDSARALRELHGLTAAEARVALQLIEGHTAAEVAVQAGQSLATVRTHIASALGKLVLRRQAQLVARVLAL